MSLVVYSKNFAQVHNLAMEDSRLSLKAKGLLAYLNSKPSDWDFSSYRIALETKDGKDSIKAALRELDELGYIERKKLGSGRMQISICDFAPKDAKSDSGCHPKSRNPSQDPYPKSENPSEGKSLGGKIRPISKTEKEIKHKKNKEIFLEDSVDSTLEDQQSFFATK